MSTRSALAYIPKADEPTKWIGVYCHWDGYPTNRGKQIWDILHKDFLNKEKLSIGGDKNSVEAHRAVRAFIDVYIKGYKAGWSSFPEECYCHSPEFVMRDGVRESKIDNKSYPGSWCEYAYIFNKEDLTMTILGGNKEIAKIDLLGKEPDWQKIQDSEDE